MYISWGSTYLGIKFALESFPPLFLMGVRFFLFGIGIYVFLRSRGAPGPVRVEWWWSAVIGTFLMLGGSASVSYAEQWVASGLAALMLATTPLWTVLFAGIWGRWPNRLEWTGLAGGLGGVVVLNLSGDLRAHPIGAALPFATQLAFAYQLQLGFSLDIPTSVRVVVPAGATATGYDTAWGIFLRMQFDARYFMGSREDLEPPRG